MSTYVATAVAFGGSLTIPADGETIEVVDVNAPLQALADGVLFVTSGTVPRVDVISANATWTAPAGVFFARVRGWGSGGGGAAGGTGSTTTDRGLTGGSGGGAAEASEETVPVVPGTAYTVTIGAASAGGTAIDQAGADGTPSSFGALASFAGAQGGQSPQALSVTAGTQEPYSFGGQSINAGAGQYPPPPPAPGLLVNRASSKGACGGGAGVWSASAAARAYHGLGGGCPGGGLGGAGGTQGVDSGTYRGGGAGAGGAAGHGVGSNGAAGGSGGLANNPGTGNSGTPGANAISGSGGGGAGGGAGGHGSVAGGVRGSGGNGGSGRITISYSGAQAVIA